MPVTLPPSTAALFKSEIFARLRAPKNPEGKLWHITVIEAGKAFTGDNYPAEVLKAAIPLFRGLPIYSFKFGDTEGEGEGEGEGNHHLPEGMTGEHQRRLTSNQIGQVTNEVWWNEETQSVDALAAIDDDTMRTRLKNAHARGAIGKDAEQDVYGFSIFAEALKAGADGKDVTKIVRGNSLDLVTRPAAGGRFKRLVAGLGPDTEDDMADLKELTALVAGLTGELAEMKKGLETQHEQDPIAALQTWLEGLTGEQKAEAVTRLTALLTQMGAAQAQAGMPTQDEFAKLTAELAAITEEKNPKVKAARLVTLMESVKGKAEPENPKDTTIRQLQEQIRKGAITAAMGQLKLEVEGKPVQLHNAVAALALADLSGVTVSGGKVEGLQEAMTKLVTAQPYLALPVAAEVPAGVDHMLVIAEQAAAAAIATGKTPEEAEALALAAVAAASPAAPAAVVVPPAVPAATPAAATAAPVAAAAPTAAPVAATPVRAAVPTAASIAAKAMAARAAAVPVTGGTGAAEPLGQAVSIRESIAANGGVVPEHLMRRAKELQQKIAADGDIDAAYEYKKLRNAILNKGAA